MKYYISINSWNLLESFVTESLSPFAFYSKRNFGNNLSRYISSANDKVNYLVFSTKDRGGDYSIEIDDSILDRSCIKQVKNLRTFFVYSKTIYYKVNSVKFRFSSQDLLDSFIAESKILFEVKCIEKFLPYFVVKSVKEKKTSATLRKLGELFSFEQSQYIEDDNRFNLLKGAIVGYVRGELTSSGSEEQELMSKIKDIKNSFAGLNTQIMVNGIEVKNPEEYIIKLCESKKLFHCIRGEKTNSFDILTQLFMEIRKLATLRSEVLNQYKSSSWNLKYDKMVSRKGELEFEICRIEQANNITSLKEELRQIKEQEKKQGKEQGKSRSYFKKGTPEYERKNLIKGLLEKFEEDNVQYKSLLSDYQNLNQRIIESESGITQYDNAIGALFIRVSDLINDLQKKNDAGKSLNAVDLTHVMVAHDGTIALNEENANSAEIEFFNLLLNAIVKRDVLDTISAAFILSLIDDPAAAYKLCETSGTAEGEKILVCLRNYWKYKHNTVYSFSIPEDMPVLQSVMSFFLKPFGFDQIERYMLNRKYTEKTYAMMLWAACYGYAALPKTFTAILYQNPANFIEMDNLLGIVSSSIHVNNTD